MYEHEDVLFRRADVRAEKGLARITAAEMLPRQLRCFFEIGTGYT